MGGGVGCLSVPALYWLGGRDMSIAYGPLFGLNQRRDPYGRYEQGIAIFQPVEFICQFNQGFIAAGSAVAYMVREKFIRRSLLSFANRQDTLTVKRLESEELLMVS